MTTDNMCDLRLVMWLLQREGPLDAGQIAAARRWDKSHTLRVLNCGLLGEPPHVPPALESLPDGRYTLCRGDRAC